MGNNVRTSARGWPANIETVIHIAFACFVKPEMVVHPRGFPHPLGGRATVVLLGHALGLRQNEEAKASIHMWCSSHIQMRVGIGILGSLPTSKWASNGPLRVSISDS